MAGQARPTNVLAEREWTAVTVRQDTCLESAGARVSMDAMKRVGNTPVPGGEIAEFCRRHRLRKLAFFGSALRDDFGPHSDVDVLVEFEPGAAVGLFRFAGMELELSRILGGRKVDLNTPNCLSRYFRDQVVAEAVVQYVAD